MKRQVVKPSTTYVNGRAACQSADALADRHALMLRLRGNVPFLLPSIFVPMGNYKFGVEMKRRRGEFALRQRVKIKRVNYLTAGPASYEVDFEVRGLGYEGKYLVATLEAVPPERKAA